MKRIPLVVLFYCCPLALGCLDFSSSPLPPPDYGTEEVSTGTDLPFEEEEALPEGGGQEVEGEEEEVEAACGNGDLDPGEECDDGNRTDGDGCENDCTWSCEGDEECQDGLLCNGDEWCDEEEHLCKPGIPREDGTFCLSEPRSICIGGTCMVSRCGDGVIDVPAGETCEPPGKGQCDMECRGYCNADEQCPDDGDPCNGREYCSIQLHDCDRTAPLEDGAICGEFPRRICLSGVCQESICGDGFVDHGAGEECEDGNNVPGDGCENDCTYTCRTDADCDDSLPCTDDLCDAAGMHTCSYRVSAAGRLCRPAAGACDLEEYCDGNSLHCPGDLLSPAGVVCRPSAGQCDAEEVCSGNSPHCPPDLLLPPGSPCDDGEYCTGSDRCDASGECIGTSRTFLFGARAICAGVSHACVLLPNGSVKCWGLNNHGQLGDGTNRNRLAPVEVTGLMGPAEAISCGAYHTCSLLAGGRVMCWGYNVYGQIGDGTAGSTQNKLNPVDVVGLSSGVSVVSAGGYHTCAVLDSGMVKCWGQNRLGQIGDETATDKPVPTDVALSLGNVAVSVAAGGYHSCVLLTSQEVRCCGQNIYGQLGDGSFTNRYTPVTAFLEGGLDTIQLAAGRHHTCAVRGTGRLDCWGQNSGGQIGDGTIDHRPLPVSVNGLAGPTGFCAPGYEHTCAIIGEGLLQCWGRNDYGQLGDGTTSSSLTPVAVTGLGGHAVSVAAGYHFTCALLQTGEVQCWGQNSHGQLGNSTVRDSHFPVKVLCR